MKKKRGEGAWSFVPRGVSGIGIFEADSFCLFRRSAREENWYVVCGPARAKNQSDLTGARWKLIQIENERSGIEMGKLTDDG